MNTETQIWQDLTPVGKRIKDLRTKAGHTQKKLAESLGIDQSEISRIESGHKMPELRVLLILQEIYNTSVQYLLTGVSPENATVANELGLSDYSIKVLKKNQKPALSYIYRVIDILLENREILEEINAYLFADMSILRYQKGLSNPEPVVTLHANDTIFTYGYKQESLSPLVGFHDFKIIAERQLINNLDTVRAKIEQDWH